MNEQMSESQSLLHIAWRGNALFSVVSSVLILGMNRTLVEFLGLPSDADLTSLGMGLMVYAGWLLWNARRQTISVLDAWIAVVLDMLWVAGSYVLLFTVRFSGGGKWV